LSTIVLINISSKPIDIYREIEIQSYIEQFLSACNFKTCNGAMNTYQAEFNLTFCDAFRIR